MKKEFIFIITLSLCLITLVFFTTLPGRLRADKAEESSRSTSETSETTETTPQTTVVTEPEPEADNPWALYVVSEKHPLPDDFKVYPKKIQGDYEMDYRAANYFIDMVNAAADDGIEIKVVSALRTIEYQKNLLDREIASFKEQGYSDEEAYKKAVEGVALPGASEHNAGLAVDLNSLEESFENEFRWLDEHAHEYGFILRYPKDKKDITGIYYEPWHYRFVGVYHAGKIKESGLTLEEYCEQRGV